MKALALAAACFVAIAFTATSQERNQMTKDQQDVLSAVEAMTAAFHAKDIVGVMASYESPASIAFQPAEPVQERTVQTAMFEGFFAVDPTFTYSGYQVMVNGDLALHIAPWDMTGTAPDGQVIHQSGLSVAVLHRQVDGRWLIVIDNPHGQPLMPSQ